MAGKTGVGELRQHDGGEGHQRQPQDRLSRGGMGLYNVQLGDLNDRSRDISKKGSDQGNKSSVTYSNAANKSDRSMFKAPHSVTGNWKEMMSDFARGRNRRESFECRRGDSVIRTRADSMNRGNLREYSNTRKEKHHDYQARNYDDSEGNKVHEIRKTDWRCKCGGVNYERNEDCRWCKLGKDEGVVEEIPVILGKPKKKPNENKNKNKSDNSGENTSSHVRQSEDDPSRVLKL